MTRYKDEKENRTWMECILQTGQHHAGEKCANDVEEKII